MFSTFTRRLIATLLLFAVAAFTACSGDTNDPNPNVLPTVRIVTGPPEGSTTHYFPEIFWDAFDQDGVISHFQYVMANHRADGSLDPADTTGAAKWIRIDAFDNVFTVSADLIPDTSSYDPTVLVSIVAEREHTFFVHAIDNAGARSLEPARRSFTSRNLSPVVDFTVPHVAGTDSVVISTPLLTFQWLGIDYVQSLIDQKNPIALRWISINADSVGGTWDTALAYIRDNPDAPEWSAWLDYELIQTVTTDTLVVGNHVLALQVVDEAGAVSEAIDLLRNALKIVVQAAP